MTKLVNKYGSKITPSNHQKVVVCECCGVSYTKDNREHVNPSVQDIGINLSISQDKQVLPEGTSVFNSNQYVRHTSIPLDDGDFLNLRTVHVK